MTMRLYLSKSVQFPDEAAQALQKTEPDTTGRLEGQFKPAALSEMIKQLNRIVSAEYSQWLRYHHYALVLRGHSRDVLAEEFKSHGDDELRHAERVASRVVALGASPSTEIESPVTLHDTEEILKELLYREQKGIQLYREVLVLCGENEGTRQIIESNIEDEQHHVDDLWRLLDDSSLIKAGAAVESAGRSTFPSAEQAKRQYDNSFERQAQGITGGDTPDLPDQGRDWHGTVPGVKDEPQDSAQSDGGGQDDSDEQSPVQKVWANPQTPFQAAGTPSEHEEEQASAGPKNPTQDAIKSFSGAPRFAQGPLIPPREKEWLLTQGYSPEEVETGQVQITPWMRAEFNRWLQGTIRKSLFSLNRR